MSDVLLDGWTQVDGATPRSRPYRQANAKKKIVLHMIQCGPEISHARLSALGKAHKNGPHLWYAPAGRHKVQTVPLNFSAKALLHDDPAGVNETNHAWALQCELAGMSEEAHRWSSDWLRNVALDVIVPIVEEYPEIEVVGRPTYGNEAYGEHSVSRMSWAEWEDFGEVCCHQHVPGNHHWDCGRLDLNTICSIARGALGEAQEEVPVGTLLYVKNGGTIGVTDGVGLLKFTKSDQFTEYKSKIGAKLGVPTATIDVSDELWSRLDTEK